MTVPAASGSFTVYFSTTTAGSVTLQMASGELTAATADVSVGPAAASDLMLEVQTDIIAGDCVMFTTRVQDAYGNAATVGEYNPTMSMGGNGAYYSDAGCTTITTGGVEPRHSHRRSAKRNLLHDFRIRVEKFAFT